VVGGRPFRWQRSGGAGLDARHATCAHEDSARGVVGLLQSLRNCSPPLTVHVDCEAVLKMIARGKKWCVAARTRHADVWRLIWLHLDDIGLGAHGVIIAKCAAHLTRAQRNNLDPFQAYVSELNEVADSWAKHGADMDVAVQWHVQALHDQHAQVKSLAKLMADVEQGTRGAQGGRIDTQTVEGSRGLERLKPPRRRRQAVAKLPEHPHMLRYLHGVLICDVCPRKATTVKGKARMQREECRRMHKYDIRVGTRGGRSGHRCDLGHLVWRTGAWTWCHRCGLHSMHKIIGLKPACKGKFANSQAKVRRDRLRQGRHPYSDILLGAHAAPVPRRASVSVSASTATRGHTVDTSTSAADPHANAADGSANVADAHASTSAADATESRVDAYAAVSAADGCKSVTLKKCSAALAPTIADSWPVSAFSVSSCADPAAVDSSADLGARTAAAGRPVRTTEGRKTRAQFCHDYSPGPDHMECQYDCSQLHKTEDRRVRRRIRGKSAPPVAATGTRRGGPSSMRVDSTLARRLDACSSGSSGGGQDLPGGLVGMCTASPLDNLGFAPHEPSALSVNSSAWQRRLAKWRASKAKRMLETFDAQQSSRSVRVRVEEASSSCVQPLST